MLSHILVYMYCIVYIKIKKIRNTLFILAKTLENHKIFEHVFEIYMM